MKIAILVKGKTELAFKSHLLEFLHDRLVRDSGVQGVPCTSEKLS